MGEGGSQSDAPARHCRVSGEGSLISILETQEPDTLM